MARSPSAAPEEKHTRTGRKVVPTFKVVSKAAEKVKEKIKVPVKARSALVAGEGRSMGMDVD